MRNKRSKRRKRSQALSCLGHLRQGHGVTSLWNGRTACVDGENYSLRLGESSLTFIHDRTLSIFTLVPNFLCDSELGGWDITQADLEVRETVTRNAMEQERRLEHLHELERSCVWDQLVEPTTNRDEAKMPDFWGFKGFDPFMRCKGFQFFPGGTFELRQLTKGWVRPLKTGFHASAYPASALEFYPQGQNNLYFPVALWNSQHLQWKGISAGSQIHVARHRFPEALFQKLAGPFYCPGLQMRIGTTEGPQSTRLLVYLDDDNHHPQNPVSEGFCAVRSAYDCIWAPLA